MKATRREFLAASAAAIVAGVIRAGDGKIPIVVVVTDPLSADLSCPCVAGYGQRDYKALGTFLAARIGRPVDVHFHAKLAGALDEKTAGRADLIIGKDSMMRAEAKEKKIDLTMLASLTGKEGETTQTGLIVVPAGDAAISADQLKGYRFLFGPESAEEKHAAPKALLGELGVDVAAEDKATPTCTDCATKLVDAGKANEKAAGVISSYALPLLEGCGTIKKGDLRVIGTTDPVPFISAFANAALPADVRDRLKAALLEVAKDEELCRVLETKLGFIEPADAKKK